MSGHRKRSSRLATSVRRLPARFRRRFDRDPLAIHQHSTRPATTRLDLARLGSARLRSVRVELRSTDGAAYRQAVVSIHTLLLESARSTLTNTVSPPRPILDPPMHARTHAHTHTHTQPLARTRTRELSTSRLTSHPTIQPASQPYDQPVGPTYTHNTRAMVRVRTSVTARKKTVHASLVVSSCSTDCGRRVRGSRRPRESTTRADRAIDRVSAR